MQDPLLLTEPTGPPVTTTTTTPGPPLECEDKEVLRDDVDYIDKDEVKIILKDTDNDKTMETPDSLQAPVIAPAGIKKVKVKIPVKPTDEIAYASLPTWENIEKYRIKVKRGGETQSKPLRPGEVSMLSVIFIQNSIFIICIKYS